jgi:hypothetical protein
MIFVTISTVYDDCSPHVGCRSQSVYPNFIYSYFSVKIRRKLPKNEFIDFLLTFACKLVENRLKIYFSSEKYHLSRCILITAVNAKYKQIHVTFPIIFIDVLIILHLKSFLKCIKRKIRSQHV